MNPNITLTESNINHIQITANIIQQDHVDQKITKDPKKIKYVNWESPFGEFPKEFHNRK